MDAARSGRPKGDPAPPEVAPDVLEVDGISVREAEILSFERRWFRHAGGKEQAVRELFGLSATRYYQVLNALIDRPEAEAFDPMLVRRLRRLRQSRQRTRQERLDP